MSRFYEAGPLKEAAINLFYGCGYNFYRESNQLRADDQKVRSLISEILGLARKAVVAAEGDYRRDNIKPPTRANPLPDADAVSKARRLESIASSIGSLEGQVRHAPVPENDRMTQRHRDETETLAALIDKDTLLVGQVDELRKLVVGRTPEQILEASNDIVEGVSAITDGLAARRIMVI